MAAASSRPSKVASAVVRQLFAEALARHGLAPCMDSVYEAELPNLPPQAA